jgi:hypothetical protein
MLINQLVLLRSSVGDPDQHVFGPPGSRSDPFVRGTEPAPASDPSLSLKDVERTEIMLEK